MSKPDLIIEINGRFARVRHPRRKFASEREFEEWCRRQVNEAPVRAAEQQDQRRHLA